MNNKNDPVPTRAELVEGLRPFLAELARHAARSEREGKLPAADIQWLREHGYFRVLQPRSLGGHGHNLETLLTLVKQIAAVCGSTAWVYVLYAVHGWILRTAPPRILPLLLAGRPDALIASCFLTGGVARLTGDVVEVSGEWPYITGLDSCEWIKAPVRFDGSDAEAGSVFLRPAEVEALRNWSVGGLQATGSHGIRVSGLRLPRERFVAVAEWRADSLPGAEPGAFEAPMEAVVALGTAAPMLGMARALLAEYEMVVARKSIRGALAPGPVERVGRLAIRGYALDVFHTQLVSMLDRGALRSGDPRLAEIRMGAAYLAAECVALAGEVVRHSGTSAVFTANPMQRQYASLMALSTHFFVNDDNAASGYGWQRVEARQRKLSLLNSREADRG